MTRSFRDIATPVRAQQRSLATLTRSAPIEGTSALQKLTPIFIHVTMRGDPKNGIGLDKMTLKDYVQKAELLTLSYAIADGEVTAIPGADVHAAWSSLQAELIQPNRVVVAHPAAFTVRVLRHRFGLNQPAKIWCTEEGARASWPDLLGGYSLPSLVRMFGLPVSSRGNLLASPTKEAPTGTDGQAWVSAMRLLYGRQARRLDDREQRIGLMTQHVRGLHLCVDGPRYQRLAQELGIAIAGAATAAGQVVDAQGMAFLQPDQLADIFRGSHKDGSLIRSVAYDRLKAALEAACGSAIPTTSMKKLDSGFQAQQPAATEVLRQAGRVGKALVQTRKAQQLQGIDAVDVELAYFGAVTGRFSSPSLGVGIPLHGIPKHDTAIAKPVRQAFSVPVGSCLVRGDLANVEYRVTGLLTNCATIHKALDEATGGDRLRDPYTLAWSAMTGQMINKKDPIRQVAKTAVLGLTFLQSAGGYAVGLSVALGDPKSGITLPVLQILLEQAPRLPDPSQVKRIVERKGCTILVATAAILVHASFHRAHPEIEMTAAWLVDAVKSVAACRGDLVAARDELEKAHRQPRAPDAKYLRLFLDSDIGDLPSVRVQCGPWPAMLTWREPAIRVLANGREELSILKAYKEPRAFTRQIAIENVVQAAARNGLCIGLLALQEQFNFTDILHVHDEVMLVVPRQRDAVLAARAALLSIFGPSGTHPMSWTMLMKPEEITVTQSLWEDAIDVAEPCRDPVSGHLFGGDRWGRLERNADDALKDLP